MVEDNANTVAVTPIGPLNLRGINCTVPTTLQGLRFLNSTPTTINSLDVTGGTTSGLSLAINVSMSNPSDFSISTGDVSLIWVPVVLLLVLSL
jgi:phosphatidylserine decarboxylase